MFLWVVMLVMLPNGGQMVSNVGVWAPEPVVACSMRIQGTTWFECLTPDDRIISWEMKGIHKL
jgi:hypothetical protein